MTSQIQETITKNFEYNNFVYTYYRFLDKFHTEPADWRALFEFTSYLSVDGKINKIIADWSKKE